jgi:soluble lytic murein transglycosylase-like protein
LRDIGSSFRSFSRLFFLLLFTFSLADCRAEDIWGVAESEALDRLREGDAGFLRLEDFSPQTQAQAWRLGPGAPYYLAQWFRDLGMPDRARAMLWMQWQRGGGRWKEEAGLELLAEQGELRQWEEAERLARQLLPSMRSPLSRWRCERALTEALYWQRRDAEALDRVASLENRRAALGVRDEELELFRAAASARLGTPGWPDLFRVLFFERRASELHPRALSFLELEDRLARFGPEEAAYFGAKEALFEGRASDALDLLEKALPHLAASLRAGSPVPEEAAAAALAAGQAERGLRLLLLLVDAAAGPQASPQARMEALEPAGRLARRAGDTDTAERLLREAAQGASEPARRDRAAWQLLDAARDRSSEAFLEELGRQVAGWADPAVFDRLLDEEISGLVAKSAWSDLARLRAALGPKASPATGARLAYLAGRAAALRPGGGSDAEPSYRQAAGLDPGGYYSWLASSLLAGGVEWAAPVPPPDEQDPEEQPSGEAEDGLSPGAARASEPFLLGFIEYGLYKAGYERILAERRGHPPAFLLRAARELNRREQWLPSLRLMNLVLAAQDRPPRREELELFYPRGYRDLVEDLCREEDLPPALFFALVREESHFDPRIVSSSGAVGLAQLLPDTAKEVAGRMRLPDPDLNDPRQNLTLGARYLSRMLGLTGDVPRALMAYNAGLSRVRSWDRSFAGLPEDLLVEAAPFSETRRYVRKILVSAVHYGYLYAGLTAVQTVRLFYPHFAPFEEVR